MLLAGQVLVRPLLEAAKSGLERAAAIGEAVLDAHRRALEHPALDDALGLELLEPLAEEAVGELGHEMADAGEVERAVHQDEQDRSGPAFADEFDGAVVEAAASRTAAVSGRRWCLFCRAPAHAVCRGCGHGERVVAQAACWRRPSSCEPSRGTSPDLVTSELKSPSDTCATVSR